MSRKRTGIFFLLVVPVLLVAGTVYAQPVLPQIQIGVAAADDPQEVAVNLQILALLTILSLAPSIIIMTTAFIRVVVVLSFTRSALALQQTPPNQVVIGLALFLTFFIMAPTWQEVNEQALQPYLAGEIGHEEAFSAAAEPVKRFMYRQTRPRDLRLFMQLAEEPRPEELADIPLHVLVPAFVISELKTAFQMGFMLYIPFLVIDMIVASTLMAMGMLMLPPVMISLPFKVMLFVLVDGWNLVVSSIISGFR
ncbi:MAG: flagellar type III secretion system pore protein FliP [Firmicutes bacterium]|jgi:flagellar biosynthetic protein FliP|nr:flagellar type III secretion system pore protein FliP [Bacillota bacterium]